MEPDVYLQMQRIEDIHWWFVGRRAIVHEILGRADLHCPCRVLDVGCGTGGNLPMLAAFGEVTGIEMNAVAHHAAENRGANQVLLGRFPEALSATDEKFGLITFLDVLEHLDDDLAALKAAKDLLAPAGTLLITVPAFKFLWNGHDEQHHHRRRYTASQLKKVLKQAGLKPVYVSYFNMWLFPVIAAIRVAKKLVGNRHADDERMPSAWINQALETVFASERHLLGRCHLPVGVSLLAIARHTSPDGDIHAA